MKNFDWTSFTKRIAVKSSLPEIYDAWTVAHNLEKWFLERVHFRNKAGLELAAGDGVEPADEVQRKRSHGYPLV